MEGSYLRFFLKCLCDCFYWDYAMFWKLNHYAPMALTWLDGYYSDSKTKHNKSENVDNGDKDGMPSSARNCLQLLLAAMSSLQYTLGEGFVGKIAATGDHCWVFCDNIFNWQINSTLISECPNEWLYQFTFGIKTVVVIPVLPHGVLHLGSFEMVAENMAMVASARRWLNDIFCTSVDGDISAQESFSCLAHSPLDIMDGLSFTTINPTAADNTTDFTPSTSRNSVDEQSIQISEEILELLRNTNMDDIDFPPNWVYGNTQETDEFHAPFQSKNMLANDYFQAINDAVAFTEGFNGVNFVFAKDSEEQQTRNENIEDSSHKHANDSLQLSADYELREALRPVDDEKTDNYFTDSFFVEDGCSILKSNSNVNYHNDTEVSWLSKGEDETEYLLDAVVGKLYSRSASDNNLSSISNNTRASTQLSSVTQQQTQTQECKSMVENPGSKLHLKPASESNGHEPSKIARVPASTESDTVDNHQHEQANDQTHNKNEAKNPNSGRKRKGYGTNQRPRPRDRQLIQERVKELRELVPQGTSCSIDGLLDRTIRHMLHLREVTEQAEKLRRYVYSEGVESERSRTRKYKHPGKSYAFEFGNEHQICPIIIEDIEFTRHMRIEMICDDHGMFLKIVETIRRLQLIILKGVLENNKNTKWARFIVEVPEAFNRMEIFWPLMHLLQLRTSRT